MTTRRAILLLLGTALALAAVAVVGAGSASAANYDVSIVDFDFTPENVTIQVGDTVTWTNNGSNGHDVTFEAGFGSGNGGGIAPAGTYAHTFADVGVFRYRCQAHAGGYGPAYGMTGTIIVLNTSQGGAVTLLSAPTGPFGPNQTLTFSGLVSDNETAVNVFVSIDNVSVGFAPATNASGNDPRVKAWTFSINTSTLTPGPHEVEFQAEDNTSDPEAPPVRVPVVVQASVTLTPVSPPTTWFVEMRALDFVFFPAVLEIATGDTVVWINNASQAHDVLFTAGFGSGAPQSLPSGANYSHTFDTVGTFHYICQVHDALQMEGDIIVYDRALRPALQVSTAVPSPLAPGATAVVSGRALDNAGVTAIWAQVDNRAPTAVAFEVPAGGDARNVTWTYNLSTGTLLAGSHTLKIYSSNGGHNSTVYTVNFLIAAAGGGGGPPSGNPFGETFLFEDIMAKYFWLITGVGIILLAVVMMFLSYSGKLQNYYIVLLTALDERHRFFAFARPTREFLYTIQRQMPRTHTERYNLKVIWYWYPLYCLGGLSFAAFIILTITGIILGFYYIPEGTGPNEGLPSKAYESMETIMTRVSFGYIFRALHHWGAHMMVAAVFLHMMRVYFVGAYKNPRELNWLLGVTLFLVTILFGYTGYLLPWDQLAFWAGQIGLEMAYTVPVVGELTGNMIFGGPELSGATIIRMYYLHVFILPLIGGALMVLHMGIVWMQGVAEPH